MPVAEEVNFLPARASAMLYHYVSKNKGRLEYILTYERSLYCRTYCKFCVCVFFFSKVEGGKGCSMFFFLSSGGPSRRIIG